jgi:hypothetical protein
MSMGLFDFPSADGINNLPYVSYPLDGNASGDSHDDNPEDENTPEAFFNLYFSNTLISQFVILPKLIITHLPVVQPGIVWQPPKYC